MTMPPEAGFQENLIDLCSITLPSFSCHENHVFHSGSESLLEMQTQSPCGQTCKSNRMSPKKIPILAYKIILESDTSTERGVWYWPIILYHFTLSHSSECLEQRTDFVIAHLHINFVKTCKFGSKCSYFAHSGVFLHASYQTPVWEVANEDFHHLRWSSLISDFCHNNPIKCDFSDLFPARYLK